MKIVKSGWAVPGPVCFFVLAAGAAFALAQVFKPMTNNTSINLYFQDRWFLLLGAGLLALSSIHLANRKALGSASLRVWSITVLGLLIVGFAGHSLVLTNYDMSRDEQLASFDASVFSGGHLVEHLPALWRDHSDALDTNLMYAAPHRVAWISGYLPFNAVFRALLGLIASPALTGPLMTAIGAFALWGCVRRLWPDDHEAPVVALLLYAGSAQIVVTAMTSYAMPAHLALNLCWLWLFLGGRRSLDLAAIVVGFVATGLHQPLMHAMFVAPFLFLLIADRRWDRAALYGAAYLAIMAFWFLWPIWIWTLVEATSHAARPSGVDFVTRLTAALREGDPHVLPELPANLLRFIAWQHLLLVPLAIVGARLARHDPMIAALVRSILLTFAIITVIVPYQGLGFGYRYFHGLIGNFILLAIFGWRSLGPAVGQWRSLLLRTSAASMIVLIPLQARAAHDLYAPAARVSARIDTIAADYAVIGIKDVPFSADLVINPAKLDRRPIRLLREKLDESGIHDVCQNHPSVALASSDMLRPITDYYSIMSTRADVLNQALAPRLVRAGCRVSLAR